jgi:hypothetical protein
VVEPPLIAGIAVAQPPKPPSDASTRASPVHLTVGFVA